MFNTHEFKFCEKVFSGTLTDDASTQAQQSDHQSTIGWSLVDPDTDEVVLVLDDTNYLGHRDFFAVFPDPSTELSALPSNWTEFAGLTYFNCPVDKEYEFKQRYFRIPTDMSATTDVPDVPATFRELLELWALYRAEKYRQNHDIAATYKQEFEDELESMVIRHAPVVSSGPTIARQTRRRV